MNKITCKSIFLCLVLLFTGAVIYVTNAQPGTWEIIDIPAPSLKNNLLGEKTVQNIGVYLPHSYFSGEEKHYPVIYYLCGYSSQVGQGRIFDILDKLIHDRQVPEMIYVEIDGFNPAKGSFYVNSDVTGNWESFVTEDVIKHMDENYRTIPDRESRAITGLSMGGYGALNLSMLHPELYNCVYGMSPGLFDENGLAEYQVYYKGGTIKEILKLLNLLQPLSAEEAHDAYMKYIEQEEDFNVLFTLAYGMAFAPQTSKAPYFEYPVSVENGDTIINKEIWHKWESGFGNVKEEIKKYGDNLRKFDLYTTDCGYNDEYKWITKGTLYYCHLLTENKIAHRQVWHTGGHVSLAWQQFQYSMFPLVSGFLKY